MGTQLHSAAADGNSQWHRPAGCVRVYFAGARYDACMSDESPAPPQAARRISPVATWVGEQAGRDAVMYTGAAAILLPCAVAATLGTYFFIFGVLWVLKLSFFGSGGTWVVYLLALAVVGLLFWTNTVVDREEFETYQVDLSTKGMVALHVSRLTGNSWMMLLASPSDMHALVRIISNALLIGPRLFEMSWAMWKLSRRLRSIDPGPVGKAIGLLMKAGGRVPLAALLEEFPHSDSQRLVDDVTAVDGVVFLSTQPPGLTVTPTLMEEYETWRSERRTRRDPPTELE